MDNQAIKDEICDRIAAGETLTAICEDVHMPKTSAISTWRKNDDQFEKHYLIARDCQSDRLRDELIDISDNTADQDVKYGSTVVQRDKLRAETRKWLLSKELAHKYGEKMNVEHSGGVTQKRIVVVRSFDEVEITDKRRRGLGLSTPN